MCCFFKKRKKIVKALFQSFPLVQLFSSTLTFFSLLAVLIYGSPSQNGKTANFTPQKKNDLIYPFFTVVLRNIRTNTTKLSTHTLKFLGESCLP